MSHLSTPLETLYPSIGSPSIKTWCWLHPVRSLVFTHLQRFQKNPFFQDITE